MFASRVSLLLVAGSFLLRSSTLAAQALPPANVTVAQGPSGVAVAWSMIKDARVSYRVVRATDPSVTGKDLTNPLGYLVTGFEDRSAVSGVTYFYRVIAVYGPGVEAASLPVQFPAPTMVKSIRGTIALPPPPPAPPPAPIGMTLTAVAPPGPGPAPTYLRVTGTPAEAHVTWTGQAGASGYTVTRWNPANPSCCRAQSAMLPANASSYDDLVQWSGTYTFRVTAFYPPDAANPSGRQGYADAPYTYPQPVAPTGFRAALQPDGTVQLTWDPVLKASGYVVAGPPSNVAFRVTGTSTILPAVGSGTHTWQLWTQYDPPSGAPSAAGSSKVQTSLTLAASGRYRVTAQAIQVSQTTGDAPNVGKVMTTWNIKNDGAGDEVFVTSLAQTLKRSDHQVIQTFPIQVSAVHGDVGAWPQDRRVRAGSASGNGGLNPGDVISPVFGVPAAGAQGWPPFILWEGQLTNGTEDLVLHPVIWDADQPDSELSRILGYCPFDPKCAGGHMLNWARVIVNSSNGAFLPAAQTAYQSPQISVVAGNVIWIESEPYFRHLELQETDRPIGLENDGTAPKNFGVTGRWRDVQVVLSREKVEAALTSGNNTISLRMWEHWALPGVAPTYNNQAGGDYTLVLRIERVP